MDFNEWYNDWVDDFFYSPLSFSFKLKVDQRFPKPVKINFNDLLNDHGMINSKNDDFCLSRDDLPRRGERMGKGKP